jgi:diguanylate cyclase (GGDEF)-like protein/PAS domain S-box-containing protein
MSHLTNSLRPRLILSAILPLILVYLWVYFRYKIYHLDLLFMITIMGFFIYWWSDKFIFQKLALVLATAKQITAGELTARTKLKFAQGEIEQLAKAVDEIGSLIEEYQAEKKSLEMTLKEKEKKYRSLMNSVREVFFQTNEMGLFTFLSPAWTTITGLNISESIGENFSKYIYAEDLAKHQELFTKKLAKKIISDDQATTDNHYLYEIRHLNEEDELKWLEIDYQILLSTEREIIGTSGTIHDITEQKKSEEELRQYAFYDSLTNLPNQTLFLEKLQKITTSENPKKNDLFAILFLELDRFQVIKYSLGHEIAEDLLIEAARRLDVTLRTKESYMARVGLNQFAILLMDLQTLNEATHFANRIYQRLLSPFNLHGNQVFIGINIGIAPSSIIYEKPEDLIRAADTAMHQAKTITNSYYAVFEPKWQEEARERLRLESDLRKAIERQEFRVYYQPIISLITGEISGFEALVRWQHPTLGFVSPAKFIPLAEEAGLVNLIDQWVLYKACRQVGSWQEKFKTVNPLTISVNFSARQLSPLIALSDRIDRILQETGLAPYSLKLEITESVIMQNAAVSVTTLEKLKKAGIMISIDDFGTGYSSLARLNQLPIDTLKIDQSFVMNMNGQENLEIVRTIIGLAHSLSLDVVAEGVETALQLETLRQLKCEYGQGYLFSRPVDNQKAEELLSSHPCW